MINLINTLKRVLPFLVWGSIPSQETYRTLDKFVVVTPLGGDVSEHQPHMLDRGSFEISLYTRKQGSGWEDIWSWVSLLQDRTLGTGIRVETLPVRRNSVIPGFFHYSLTVIFLDRR